MATVPSALGHSRISNARWETVPCSRIGIKEDFVVEEGTVPSEEVPLPMNSLAW